MKKIFILIPFLVLSSFGQAAQPERNKDQCTYVEYETGVYWEQSYNYSSCPNAEQIADRVYGGQGISGNYGQSGTRMLWVVRNSVINISWPNTSKKVVIKAETPAVKISCGGFNIHELYCNQTALDKVPDNVDFPFGKQIHAPK